MPILSFKPIKTLDIIDRYDTVHHIEEDYSAPIAGNVFITGSGDFVDLSTQDIPLQPALGSRRFYSSESNDAVKYLATAIRLHNILPVVGGDINTSTGAIDDVMKNLHIDFSRSWSISIGFWIKPINCQRIKLSFRFPFYASYVNPGNDLSNAYNKSGVVAPQYFWPSSNLGYAITLTALPDALNHYEETYEITKFDGSSATTYGTSCKTTENRLVVLTLINDAKLNQFRLLENNKVVCMGPGVPPMPDDLSTSPLGAIALLELSAEPLENTNGSVSFIVV